MFKIRILLFALTLGTIIISCREATKQDASKDVVEDMDNMFQEAENNVKEAADKNSSLSIEERIRQEDSIRENQLQQEQ